MLPAPKTWYIHIGAVQRCPNCSKQISRPFVITGCLQIVTVFIVQIAAKFLCSSFNYGEGRGGPASVWNSALSCFARLWFILKDCFLCK